MTATSGKMLPVGLRYASVFDIDSNGRPAASSTAVYEGVQLEAAKSFELTPPDPRIFDFGGDDVLIQTDVLPVQEGIRATISAAKDQFAIHELLTDTKQITIGEAKEVGHGTDRDGFFPQVALHMWQQALDGSGVNRSRRWRSIIIPCGIAYPKPIGMTDNLVDVPYTIVAQKVTQRLWGTTLVLATDGYTNALVFEYMTEYKPCVVAWKGDNSATKFTFHADRQAVSVAKIHTVTINGVNDGSVAKAVDGVTPTAKPGSSDIICCFYEYA